LTGFSFQAFAQSIIFLPNILFLRQVKLEYWVQEQLLRLGIMAIRPILLEAMETRAKLLQNSPYAPLELYNVKDDPQEKKDLFASQQRIARELQVALRRHVQRGGAVPWQPPAGAR
jgi:hypothetical protein